MATLIFGYDVEVCDPQQAEVTREFLRNAVPLHRELQAPCTMFICGKTLEMSPDAFRPLAEDPLFDLQSHSYGHSLLKGDLQWQGGQHIGRPDLGQVRLIRGASLAQIHEEITRTRDLLQSLLGLGNIGLRLPTGAYMGLVDRPEVLELLWEAGIRYVSSYHLHAEDFLHWQVMPPAGGDIVQPFWYSQVQQSRGYAAGEGEPALPDHLPAIYEFPIFGAALDCVWKDMYGYDAYEGYLNSMKVIIDVVARQGLVLSYVQHDWSSIKGDPSMRYTRAIIAYAQAKGLELVSHTEFYRRAAQRKEA